MEMKDLIVGNKYRVTQTSEPDWYKVGNIVTYVGNIYGGNFFTGNSGKTRTVAIKGKTYEGCSIHYDGALEPYDKLTVISDKLRQIQTLAAEVEQLKSELAPWTKYKAGDKVKLNLVATVIKTELPGYTGKLPMEVYLSTPNNDKFAQIWIPMDSISEV